MRNFKIPLSFLLLLAITLLVSCQKNDSIADFDETDFEAVIPHPELTDLVSAESVFIGTWARTDTEDGTIQYFIFNEDRTGCFWKQTTPTIRGNKKAFKHWKLVKNEAGAFKILVQPFGNNITYSEGLFYPDRIRLVQLCREKEISFKRSGSSKFCE